MRFWARAVAWPLAARAEQRPRPCVKAGFDPRITPARPDLAAKHLAGTVEAERFVEGKAYRDRRRAGAGAQRSPRTTRRCMTEALKGERITIYETSEDGWAWGQLAGDGYVGFVPASALRAPGLPRPTR